MHVATKAEIIKHIQQLVPVGSPEPQDPIVLATLKELTANLIQAYMAEGRLQENPFADALGRTVHLYESEVSSKLKGKVVLVTGGEGCVGSNLLKKLIELGVKRVVSVDKARCSDYSDINPIDNQKSSIILYAADVRNYDTLKHIFDIEKPDIVFHLAAQRLPWLAEIEIRETVTTSILGIQNITQLCELYGVQQCIFSSTGKASRYFTTEVYAASKKLAEWQFAQAALQGNVTYGMVRFTHMLENSSVCEKIDNKIHQGKIVNIHAPERYVSAQNVGEALHLLLNALVLSELGILKFLTVRNLGWPIETLEVALYKIFQSGEQIPIYFQGLEPGYEEPFFLGQFDWSKPTEIHPLINALEDSFKTIDTSGDMIITEIAAFDLRIFNKQLATILKLASELDLPNFEIKNSIVVAQKEIVSSIFSWNLAQDILKILKWGINSKEFKADGISIDIYQDIVNLLVQSLYGRMNKEVLKQAAISIDKFEDLVEILFTLSSIRQEVAYLRQVSKNIRKLEDSQNGKQVICVAKTEGDDKVRNIESPVPFIQV